jgi:3-hydroxyacyl-CoA dehydrogenase
MPQAANIGTGLIGRSWAIVFARAGWDVALHDAEPDQCERAKVLIEAGLENLAAAGLLEEPGEATARVRIVKNLAQAVEHADFVQENVAETIEAKTAIFRELDRCAPADVVLASSTSAIVASRFTQQLTGRSRCLVAHPVNPPHLVPLVELVGAAWTSAQTIARAEEIYESIGQVPIVVRKEVDGFILNRLQGALVAEAFRLVEEGYVSPQDLDKTVKDGLGLRWSFLGPFETIELNAPGGIADYCARYAGFYQRLLAAPAGPEVFSAANVERILAQWASTASPERLEARTCWRDQRLAALVAHKRSQPKHEGS